VSRRAVADRRRGSPWGPWSRGWASLGRTFGRGGHRLPRLAARTSRRTTARISRRPAFDSRSHATATSRKPASVETESPESAPHFAPPEIGNPVFPGVLGDSSCPVPATCFFSSETGRPTGYTKGRRQETPAFLRSIPSFRNDLRHGGKSLCLAFCAARDSRSAIRRRCRGTISAKGRLLGSFTLGHPWLSRCGVSLVESRSMGESRTFKQYQFPLSCTEIASSAVTGQTYKD